MISETFVQPTLATATRCSPRILLDAIRCAAVAARLLREPGETIDYKLPIVDIRWATIGSYLVAMIPMELFATSLDADGSEKPGGRVFEVNATYRLQYRQVEGETIDATDVPHVLAVLGYIHTWPYFRADVQTMTAKLGLPALTLPVRLSGQVPELVRVSLEPLVIEEPPADSLPPELASKRQLETPGTGG